MVQKWLGTINKCQLFQGIGADELASLVECLNARFCEYKKDDIITASGDKLSGIGIVISGEAAVTKENAAGDRVIMTMLGAGDMFGEVAAFSSNGVWPATVTPQSPCSVLFISTERILGQCQKLCPSHKVLLTNMLRVISNKALLLNRKVEYLVIKSIRGKIANFLLEQYKRTGKPTFLMPMKRNELADFLNVSRPSLSREMGRMRDEGIIEFHRASIRIKDIEALKAMAE